MILKQRNEVFVESANKIYIAVWDSTELTVHVRLKLALYLNITEVQFQLRMFAGF
jgi:hypothetical protein